MHIVRETNTLNRSLVCNLPDPSREGTTRAQLTNSGLA
jgi:hypothetical protein